MKALPAETPVTMPVVTPTPAIPAALVNQKPPVGVLANAVVDPTHTPSAPVMVVGYGFTVTVSVEKQVAIPHVIITVPNANPVTTPVVGFTVAIVVLELLQLTPPIEFESVVVDPRHTVGIPVIGPGEVTTVTVVVT